MSPNFLHQPEKGNLDPSCGPSTGEHCPAQEGAGQGNHLCWALLFGLHPQKIPSLRLKLRQRHPSGEVGGDLHPLARTWGQGPCCSTPQDELVGYHAVWASLNSQQSSPHPPPSPNLPQEKSRPQCGFRGQSAVLVGRAEHGHQSEERRLGEAGREWFTTGRDPAEVFGLLL